MVRADLLYEFILRHGLGRMVDMEALRAESLDGLLTDVFKEKEPKILVVYGVQNLGQTNGREVEGVLAGDHAVMNIGDGG